MTFRAALSVLPLTLLFLAVPGRPQGSPQIENPSTAPFAYPADFVAARPDALPVLPMPEDRAAASYNIYSLLMPVGQLGGPNWPRQLWLLADTTLALIPDAQPCLPIAGLEVNMNPHIAIQPPPERLTDFTELLADFDLHCHERVHLTPELFHLVVPLRLLTQEQQEDFIQTRYDPNAGVDSDQLVASYKGAPGLSRFSQVYFNAHHTMAMVYATCWCGGLCAQSYWQVLELKDGHWERLDWHSDNVLS